MPASGMVALNQVRIDVMWIKGRAILHVVDTGTTFGSAVYLDK
jgi:hypothetical protein